MNAECITKKGSGYKATDWLYEGMLRCCVCCYPGETIFEAYPHLKDLGLRVSHSYCKPHIEAFTQGVELDTHFIARC